MTLRRKDLLVNNQIYHVFSRSIAGYVVFNNTSEYDRMTRLLDLYRFIKFDYRYSQFIKLGLSSQILIIEKLKEDNDVLVEVIAYCIMPTHFHLILRQIVDDGVVKYLSRILNSYSKSFNMKHKRVGPLWSGRFKNVLVQNDDQLLHLSRYIHLNPTSANIVNNPNDWSYSSYREYIELPSKNGICSFDNLFSFKSKQYEKFCLDRKSYQKNLSVIKSILLDNYTG